MPSNLAMIIRKSVSLELSKSDGDLACQRYDKKSEPAERYDCGVAHRHELFRRIEKKETK
jgi:hypothetical protein